MIILYRRKDSKAADEVQETLEDLVLAHRVVDVDEEQPEDVPTDRPLPMLMEGDDAYSGEQIAALLDEIGIELTYERKFSADACYVDPENPGQCI